MRNSENGFPSDRIEQSLTVRNPRGYRPSFSVEEKKEGWWLKDRDRRIAFVHRGHLTFDPFEFSPFSSLNRKIFCHPLYDMASRINMHLSLLVNVRGNFERPDAGLKMNWQVSPAQVTLRVEQRHSSGVEAVTTLISGYKPQWEAYTYHLQALIREQHPPAVREFCNFYARGAGAGIPEEKKWQWTIWEAPDGRLMKMPHNPALTFGPLKVEHLTKRVKSSGFIGYGVESDFNPVVLVRQASVPFVSGTCDMWYDEHLSLEKPGMEDRVSGWTQAQAEIELVNVKPWLMEKFLTEACPVNISRQETAMFPCLGFAWNKVNTFSRPLTPTKPWTGMVFVPGEKRWLQKVRSAKCLANKSRDFGPTQTSGWQKTKGLAGQGCL
ncbi:MAG TPA: hypothetical protein PKX93_09625, partial [bacterium]|nr:hypothetical protein [bacterium]